MDQFLNQEEGHSNAINQKDKKTSNRKTQSSLLSSIAKKPLRKCTFLLVLLIGCCELLSMVIDKLYPTTINSALDVLTA